MEQVYNESNLSNQPFSVLHVDGDMLMRKILKKTFPYHLCQLDSAADGREAFHLMERKKYHYDIVITEMHMHYANGYEIVNRLLQNAPSCAVIITSNISFFHIHEGLNLARENYFKKPLVIGRLMERISAILQPEEASVNGSPIDLFRDTYKSAGDNDQPANISCTNILQDQHQILPMFREAVTASMTSDVAVKEPPVAVDSAEKVWQPQLSPLPGPEHGLVAAGIKIEGQVPTSPLVRRTPVAEPINTGKRWW